MKQECVNYFFRIKPENRPFRNYDTAVAAILINTPGYLNIRRSRTFLGALLKFRPAYIDAAHEVRRGAIPAGTAGICVALDTRRPFDILSRPRANRKFAYRRVQIERNAHDASNIGTTAPVRKILNLIFLC